MTRRFADALQKVRDAHEEYALVRHHQHTAEQLLDTADKLSDAVHKLGESFGDDTPAETPKDEDRPYPARDPRKDSGPLRIRYLS